MIEAMDRFCRAAVSFNARCVSLASVIVSRPMGGVPVQRCGHTLALMNHFGNSGAIPNHRELPVTHGTKPDRATLCQHDQ